MLPSWMRSNAIHDMDLAIKLIVSARQMSPDEAETLQCAAELVAASLGRLKAAHSDAVARSDRLFLALDLGYAHAVQLGDFDNVDDFLDAMNAYGDDNQCTR